MVTKATAIEETKCTG